MVIGITGPTGAGKTTISKEICEKLGYTLIDADKIARDITKKGEKALEEVIACFGEEFLVDGELDRKHLAQVVFNDKEKLDKLNKITHKYITEKIKLAISQNSNSLIDVPLLFESGLDKLCNKIILVLCDENIRIERIMKRDNISEENALSRINAQKDYSLYKAKSDIVINSSQKINLSEVLAEVGNW